MHVGFAQPGNLSGWLVMAKVNFQLANRRWWKQPGEILWEDDMDGGHWQIVFDSDRTMGLWDLSIVNTRSPGERIRFCWDLHSKSMVSGDRLPSDNVRHWARETCVLRSHGIVPGDVRILRALGECLRSRMWASGRLLRQRLAMQEDEFAELLASLWPRYVIAREVEGDEYTLTLPGLCLLDEQADWKGVVPALVSVGLKAIREEVFSDPDVQYIDPEKLREAGVANVEWRLARHVLRIAALDVSDGTDGWRVPRDSEHLSRLSSLAELIGYAASRATWPRPWRTAPLVLWGVHPSQDSEMADISLRHLQTVADLSVREVVASCDANDASTLVSPGALERQRESVVKVDGSVSGGVQNVMDEARGDAGLPHVTQDVRGRLLQGWPGYVYLSSYYHGPRGGVALLLALLTIVPTVAPIKIHWLDLHVSVATGIYFAYHAANLYLYLAVQQAASLAARLDRTSAHFERLAEIRRKYLERLALLVYTLILATVVLKLVQQYAGLARDGAVRSILGV